MSASVGSVVTIELTGRVSYRDEITVAQAAKIINYLNASDPDLQNDLSSSSDGGATPQHQAKHFNVSSPREALELSGASKNPEKIVALGAYVLLGGKDNFNKEDVKTQFRLARETPPGNLTRDIGVAIALGWIIEDGNGEYLLHNKFDGMFEGGFVFPKAVGSGRARAVKNPGSRAKSGKPDTLGDIDAFHSTMNGFPPYAKLKSEKDRLLWVVVYMADKHGRSGLTNKEIDYISDQVGQGIPNAHIASAFNNNKKPGFAFRSTGDNTVRATDEGRAYLASLGAKAEA